MSIHTRAYGEQSKCSNVQSNRRDVEDIAYHPIIRVHRNLPFLENQSENVVATLKVVSFLLFSDRKILGDKQHLIAHLKSYLIVIHYPSTFLAKDYNGSNLTIEMYELQRSKTSIPRRI